MIQQPDGWHNEAVRVDEDVLLAILHALHATAYVSFLEPLSQRPPKRNTFASSECRCVHRASISVAEPPRVINEEDVGSMDITKHDGGESNRGVGQEAAPEEASDSISRRPGHDYLYTTAQDNARMHVGDLYIQQQTVVTNLAGSSTETEETKRSEFMENLGFEAMGSRLATVGIAYAETCSWLFDQEEYKRWRDPGFHAFHNGVLWIKGKPGAGKSTLMKHALQDMQIQGHAGTAIFSFFFNARGHNLEKTTEGMYRSLLHQVFSKFPSRLNRHLLGPNSGWRTQGWPLPILQNILRDALLGFGSESRFICYIDALDECSEAAIRLAVQYFEELGELAHSRAIDLSICFASRHYPNITLNRHGTINLDTEGEHHRDISMFVTRRLRGEPGLKTELSQQISHRSLGVFLWAALVVQMMNKMMDCGATRSQLLDELKLVPDGIEDLLRTIILHGDLTMLSTLQWVLFSQRQLNVHELYFAVKTGVYHLSTARNDAEETSEDQMRLFILTSSKGLVEFTCDRHPTAQFIHETVREHLLNGGLTTLDADLTGNIEAFSHARLGQWCHEYIKAFTSSPRGRAWFLLYSKNYMLAHMENAHAGGAIDLLPIDSVQHRTWISLTAFLDRAPSKDPENVTPILVLLRFQCTSIAAAILQRQLVDSRSKSNQLESSMPGNLDKPSIPAVAEVNSVCRSDYHNTLLLKSLGLHKGDSPALNRVIELLLKCGAVPNLAKPTWNSVRLLSSSSSATSSAAASSRQGSYRVLIKDLLKYGVDPSTSKSPGSHPAPCTPGNSALIEAIRLRDAHLVKLLLSFGADAQGHGTVRPLCSAAAHSSTVIVRLLLAAGAKHNDRGILGRTALHANSSRLTRSSTQLDIARVLLDAGADIDATDDKGDTALTVAYFRQRYSLVKLLVDRGANLNLLQHREIAPPPNALHLFEFDLSA
jgi:hypothetical protein